MGIDRDSAKFLLWARRQGVDFSRTMTLGRMGLHLTPRQLGRALAAFGLADTAAAQFAERDGYADPFFRLLGTTDLASMDASPFEGATVIHDLNRPVPADWHGRYSVVLDGGTLEHVFDYPTALRSCLDMVAVGGHFITVTPANNYMGHGFYQFSPELYARVLSPANGFALEKLIVFESGGTWYEVVDPAAAGRRVGLVNRRPTMLAAWARRTHEAPLFAPPPQQSDYVEEWAEYAGAARPCREAERQLKSGLRRWLRGARKWFRPRFRPRYYKRVEV